MLFNIQKSNENYVMPPWMGLRKYWDYQLGNKTVSKDKKIKTPLVDVRWYKNR